MSIEAENLDSLRKLVRELQAENTLLKKKLKKANITYPESCIFEEKIENTSEFDPDKVYHSSGYYIEENIHRFSLSLHTHLFSPRTLQSTYLPFLQ